MKRVLVIDDDIQIRRLLRISLGRHGYEVFEADSGFGGIQALGGVRPDIVLLDLNLPDKDGASVLKELREFSTLPVLILSVRNAEADIVGLLHAGADDYLTKPFNTNELLARMAVALRHQRSSPGLGTLKAGDLTIDLDAHRVEKAGRPVKLTPTEFAFLALLARHPGRIVTQATVLKELWGPLSENEAGSLRVHLFSLRKKLEDEAGHPRIILTEPGIGYRLQV